MIAPVLAEFLAGRPAIRCVLHDDIAERLGGVVRATPDLAIAGRATFA